MLQIAYQSRASDFLSSADLFQIIQKSVANNGANGLTGFLIFSDPRFFQVIEGPDDALDNLLSKLRKDTRHHSIEIVHRGEVESRSYPNWRMKRITGGDLGEGVGEVAQALERASPPVRKAIRDFLATAR